MKHWRIPTIALIFLLVLETLPCLTGPWPPALPAGFHSFAWAATTSEGYSYLEESEPFSDQSSTESVPDPLEFWNRGVFAFNDKVYFWFLKPVSQLYGIFIPPGIRTGIRNGFENVKFPVRFVNCLLQGKFRSASVETGRFLINSTIGMGGFFEVASRDFDLHPQFEDTGQTLAFYGMKPLMYVVWPILGPSTMRDSIGLGADTFLNPMYYLPSELWVGFAMRGGVIINNLSFRIGEYEDFKAAALDPYASMRQAYLQYRYNEILQ
jgi:phospholipid-binding lipoprotein MlaA